MKEPKFITSYDEAEQADGDALFRFEEATYSRGVDQFDDPLPGYTLEVHLHKFPIESKTPKGVWIVDWGGRKRFVLLTARKRFPVRR